MYLGLEFLFYEQGLSLYEIFNYPLDQINTPSEKKGIADLLASYTMRKLIVSSIDAEVIMKRWIHYLKLCDELNWSDKKPKRFITRYNEALEYSGLEPITYYADRYGKEWFYREDNAYICYGHFPCDEKGQPIMKWIGIKVKNAKSITYDADKSREGILIIELTPSTSIHAVCQYIPRENEEDIFADIQENEDEEYWLQIYEGPLNMQFNHKALKEIRVSKGMTQAELASAIGASVRTYQKWEGGETTPDGHHLLRIMNWLNITDVQELINYSDYTEKNVSLSNKIECADCGGWFGSKVWHSTDKYRRVIYRCNSKYKEKKCGTPHVTEEEVKAAFLSAYNKLVSEKAEIVANAETIRETLCRTDALEEEKCSLENDMAMLAGMVQNIIDENARIAQNQGEYQERYNGLVERYDTAKARYDEVVRAITKKEAQNERLAGFIKILKAQAGIIAEFDERLWSSMVDYITVGRNKEMAVTFRDGTEIIA